MALRPLNGFHSPSLPPEFILDLDLNKIDTIRKLEEIIKQNGNRFQEQVSKPFAEKLQNKVIEIKRNTTGLIAWFRYLFRRALQAEKLQQAAALENLRDLILGLPKPETYSPLQSDRQESDEEMDDTGSSSGSDSPKNTHGISTTSSDLSDDIDPPATPIGIPPPPPPPGAPPPPPPPGSNTPASKEKGLTNVTAKNTPVLTPEQKYLQSEQKKLDNKLAVRANPEKFYKMTPPANKKELDRLIGDKLVNIEAWKRILRSKDHESKETAEEMIANETKILAKLVEESESSLAPIRASSSEFKEKVVHYTNDELKILLIIYFLEKDNVNGYILRKQSYEKNASYINEDYTELFEEMFAEKNRLLQTKSGIAFLAHMDEWQRYMNNTSITGFLTMLKSRKRRIKPTLEPIYEITPYNPNKTISPFASKSSSKEPISLADAFKSGSLSSLKKVAK